MNVNIDIVAGVVIKVNTNITNKQTSTGIQINDI